MMPVCSLCGGSDAVACGDGHVCDICAETNRTGRDMATRKAKLAQTSLRGRSDIARATLAGGSVSDLDVYATESAALLALDDRQEGYLLGAGGEALPQDNPVLRDTMKTPGAAALDASAERLRLLDQLGVDNTATALDLADSIKASNSLEKMLSAQLAVLHTTALNYVAKANLQADHKHATSMMNLSIRAMDTFQRGVLTVKRLRSNGQQQIFIKHIDARGGGMVAVGGVPAPGAGGKT
jgi:hypothetical protein